MRLAESPVTAYKGGIKGYPATKPAKGQKIDPTSSKVVNYMNYLSGRHDAVLAAAGGGRKAYSYGYVFNGFAAELTQAQADKLRSMKGVLSVEKDVIVDMDTSSTPSFLGLDAPGGLWDQLGGAGSAGENIIIGVDRLRHLAGEPELLRPHRRQRQRDQGRQAGLPADSRAGTASANRARRSTRRSATRS